MLLAPAYVDPRTRESRNRLEGEDGVIDCEAEGMPSKILSN